MTSPHTTTPPTTTPPTTTPPTTTLPAATSAARSLPPCGDPAVDWAARLMPLLAASMAEDGPDLAGRHVGIRLHLEPKTAVLVRWLLHVGCRVTALGNVGTTQAGTVAVLRALGATVLDEPGDDAAAHDRHLDALLAAGPDIVLDNGGELVLRLAAGAPRAAGFLGATEETTSGGDRIRALPTPPDFPVVVINDSPLKLLVENELGVGHSVVQGVMNATNSMLPGARATVVGYGPCGKGVAETLQRLGARVAVADTDPFRALEAVLRGHRVAPLADLLPGTQLLLLATGARHVVGPAEIAALRDGVVVAGVGHDGAELDHAALAAVTARTVDLSPEGRPGARVVHVLADGREVVVLHGTGMVNLTAAGGNPVQAMDLGLSLQARSLAHVARGDAAGPGARPVPASVDRVLAAGLVELLTREPGRA
ncbi:NAD(P)-dependent oxidoreductase [Cellulomonas endophytica]|uniref:NAD(P)-dependent oxidoreductase n=1 Tax=Cellulomonas endophytica TaxID=2494735 RepID=UPI001012078D|nr:NAD(P)-dependent oxidoreductase [Cellulomonas endophytica]